MTSKSGSTTARAAAGGSTASTSPNTTSNGSNGAGGGAGGAVTSTGGAGPASGAGGMGSSSSTTSTTTGTAATSSSSGGNMCLGGDPTLDAEELAFVTLINDYRTQNNLPTLEHCISLDRAAQGHSEDMRDNDYFAHDGLDGSQPWDRACGACFQKGCGPTTAMGENIAAGNADAQATFVQWKNSPPHDANMRSPDFHFIGIGRATGGGMYGVYWTNVFAGEDEPSCY